MGKFKDYMSAMDAIDEGEKKLKTLQDELNSGKLHTYDELEGYSRTAERIAASYGKIKNIYERLGAQFDDGGAVSYYNGIRDNIKGQLEQRKANFNTIFNTNAKGIIEGDRKLVASVAASDNVNKVQNGLKSLFENKGYVDGSLEAVEAIISNPNQYSSLVNPEILNQISKIKDGFSWQKDVKDARNDLYSSKDVYKNLYNNPNAGWLGNIFDYIADIGTGKEEKLESDYEQKADKYYALTLGGEKERKAEIKRLEKFAKSLNTQEALEYLSQKGVDTSGYKKENEKFVITLAKSLVRDEIEDIEISLKGVTGVGEYLGDNIKAGFWNFMSGLEKTGNMLFYAPFGIEDSTYATSNAEKAGQEAYKTTVGMGDKYNWGGQIIQGLVQAAPDVALAYATGGTSATTSIATKSAGLTNTLANSVKTIAKNPVVWSSFVQTLGNDYETAKQGGASNEVALLYAFTTSTLNALVEVGGVSGHGGTQTLAQVIQDGKVNRSFIRNFIPTALDEGKEEVIQKLISDANSMLMYGEDIDVLSTDYAKDLAKEAAMGFLVGGILGGGQLTANSIINAKATSHLKGIGNLVFEKGDIQGIIDYAKKSVDMDIRALAQKSSSNLTAEEAGRLYQYAVRDISQIINTPTDNTKAFAAFESIIQQNESVSIRSIASSQYMSRLFEKGFSETEVRGQINSVLPQGDGNISQDPSTPSTNGENGGIIDSTQNTGVENDVETYAQEWGHSGNSQGGIRTLQENLGGNNDQSRTTGIEQGGSQGLRNSENRGGVTLTDNQSEELRDTAVRNEDGSPKVVYHFTENMDFEVFGKGDIGFHFGDEAQANSRGNILNKTGRIIKAYLNIKNPLNISTDIMSWRPKSLAMKLLADDIITVEQYKTILEMDSGEVNYNSPAAALLRRILSEKGYDGIVYQNMFEGDGESYIAFYPEQVIIIDDGKSGNNTDLQSSANDGLFDEQSAEFPKFDLAQDTAYKLAGKKRYTPEQKAMIEHGKALGVKVDFEYMVETNDKGEKFFPDGRKNEDGSITINTKAKKPYEFLFKHEIVHLLELDYATYITFANKIMDSDLYHDWLEKKNSQSQSESGKNYRDMLNERYKVAYGNLSPAQFEEAINREMLADFVGENLFGKDNVFDIQRFIEMLEGDSKSAFKRFIDRIIAWFKEKFKPTDPVRKRITEFEKAFAKAWNASESARLKAAETQKTTAEDSGGVRYSILEFSDGNQFVEIEADQERFDGLTPEEMRREARKVIKERFVGTVIGEKNRAFVKSKSAEEYSYPSKFIKDPQIIEAKMRASTELDNLVDAGQNYRNEPDGKDGHFHPEATGGFDYYDTVFKIGKNYYYGLVNVMVTDKGKVLKDITKIEDITNDIIAQYGNNPQGNFVEIPSNNNISKPNDKVNKKFSLPTENPKTIAELTPEDAITTPPLERQKGDFKGDKESKLYGSLLGSDIFDDAFKEAIEDNDYIKTYSSVTNKETLKKAAKALDDGGMAYVLNLQNKNPDEASLIDITAGLILIDRYQRIGDYNSAVAIAEKVRTFGTASGQQVQIFSILGRLDPNSMAAYAQQELSKAYESMVKGKTKKWIDANKSRFELTDEEIDFIRRRTLQAALLEDGTRPKAVLLAEICSLLQNKLPTEKGNSIRALQRISLLLNIKTNIRNITGNIGMVPVYIASDFFGSGIDRLVSKKTNVRTTGNFKLKGTKTALGKGLYESWDDFKRGIRTRQEELDRYDVNRGGGKSFNESHKKRLAKQLNAVAKVLNKLDNFTSFCLEAGDRPFFEMFLNNSLNNQMRLNNVEIPTPEMLEIAKEEALQRTWQDNNTFTNTVSNIKRNLNRVHIWRTSYGFGDFVLKFVKTPSNIAKAIVEFSPVGLTFAGAKFSQMKNAMETGQFTPQMQKQFVKSLSNAITGTLIYALVATGAALGVVKLSGAGDEDKDVSNFEKYVAGVPPYSIEIFGVNVTYDWMQPFGSVLATVADFTESRKENPDGSIFDDLWGALKVGGQVFTQQSFLQSMYELFSSDDLIEGITSAAISEPSAFIPQFFSQTASFFDDKQRVTYDHTSDFQTAINSVINKIPGLRTLLPERVNVLGETAENNQYLDPWNAFLSPGNTYSKSTGKVADGIYELYKQTGDKTVMPRVAPNSITVKGNKIVFSVEEKNNYQRRIGSLSAEMLSVFMESKDYGKLSDEDKVSVVKKIYDYSAAKAKSELDYDYKVFSAMVGTRKNGDPIISESKYNDMSEKAKRQLIEEYFLSKTERGFKDDAEKAVKHFIKSAKD